MIEQDTMARSIHFHKNNYIKEESIGYTIKDELIDYVIKNSIEPASFLKLTTSMSNFRPIYYYTMQFKLVENQENRSSNTNKKTSEHVFKYGSQVYLRMKANPNKSKNLTKNEHNFIIQSIEPIKTSLFGNARLFFQIIHRNQYLTPKQNKQIILSNQSSNQSIWVIQQQRLDKQRNGYRLFNVSNNCYLCLSSGRAKDNQIVFNLVEQPNQNTMFIIETSKQNSQYFVFRPAIQSKIKGAKISTQQGLQIQILPVQNSVTNLFYQLKYATQIIANSPSIPILHEIIQQLIYYNISQFGQNQQLLSVPIQKLLAQVGISQAIYQFIVKVFNQVGYDAQLAFLIQNDVRLLCLGSVDNSNIFVDLVAKLLDTYQYKPYLSTLTKLVHSNTYLINKFQSYGWSQIILKKLELTFSTAQFSTFYNLLQLVCEFCYETHSIPNKYLIMHTLQKIYDESTHQKNTQEQSPYESFWVRFFQQGQFVFVEVEQQGKYSQIQLENYLQMDSSHRQIYMGEIKLIGAICSGFNINGINRFYHILKAVSSYCYNEAYPYFKYPQCKQITLEAIVTSFDWGQNSRKLQNKYNIGYVFSESEADQTKSSKLTKDMNISKYKPENTAKNIKFNLRENQTITDVLRHFILAFQDHIIYFFNQSKEKNKPLIDLLLSREEIEGKFGSNLGNWIKLICIALDARLITMLKKKAGPYTEYFKKILEPSKKSVEKQGKSKQKTFNTEKKRRNSPSNFPFTLDKQYQTQVNIILDLATKIITYNPLYDLYLQQMKVTNFKSLNSNNNFVQKMIINIRKSNLPYRSSKSKKAQLENKYEIENYNKVMYMEELLHDPEKDQIQYVNQVKLHCYKVLSLMFQNIIEEQIQYEIKNLGYSVQGPIKFTSKLTFAEGLKKFPFIDDAFRLSLLENWFMTSKPSTLQEVTTLTRYIYDQNQIHIRAINTTIALFTKQSLQLYQTIQPPMSQLQRLTQCLPTWYQPQILKACPEYEQNFNMLLRSLQAVNTQVKKSSLNNTSLLVLVDYQQMLQNLGLIDIANNLICHLSRFQPKYSHLQKRNKINKRNQQYKDMRKQSQSIYTELTKLLYFYTQYSETNRKKLLICLSQSLTTSTRNLELLTLILKQSSTIETCINLIDKNMITSIVHMLPQSTQMLELMLGVEDQCFMVVVNNLGQCLSEGSELGMKEDLRDTRNNRVGDELAEDRIITNIRCFQLFCKLAYRMMEMCSRGHQYLQWFFDRLLWTYMQHELSSNTHFKKKQIESITLPTIQQNSSICYLINSLYYKTHKSTTLKQSQPYNYRIKSSAGQKLLYDYISTELFATFLDNDSNPILAYVQYYLWDLLPLLVVFQGLLDLDQVRRTVLERVTKYLGIYQNGQNVRSEPKIQPMGEDQITMIVTSKKQKQLQNFINGGQVPKNFQPRSTSLFWKKTKREPLTDPESPRQQQDPFDKISKKAMKSWFKARLNLNQNKQHYISRDRWLTDVAKLQKQCEGEARQKQIIINQTDIISKTVSILLNSNYVCFSPENQIFLLKNFLLWLTRQTETKDKRNKYNLHHKSSYLIKKLQAKNVLLSILQQIQQKLSNSQSCKNIIAIGYQLRICFYLALLILTIEQKIKQKIVYKIITILQQLLQYYYLHEEILQQYQQSKTIDYWPTVMVSWIPICLLSQFVNRFLQVCEITVDQFELLCGCFFKASIRLKNVRSQALHLSINNTLNIMKQMSEDDFKRQNQKILADPLYQILNRIE